MMSVMVVMVRVVRGEGGRGEGGGGRQRWRRRRDDGLVRIAGGVGRRGTTDAFVTSTVIVFRGCAG